MQEYLICHIITLLYCPFHVNMIHTLVVRSSLNFQFSSNTIITNYYISSYYFVCMVYYNSCSFFLNCLSMLILHNKLVDFLFLASMKSLRYFRTYESVCFLVSLIIFYCYFDTFFHLLEYFH